MSGKVKYKNIPTKMGITSYYTMDNVYLGKLTFFVKFESEESENEFSVQNKPMTDSEMDGIVQIYAGGYCQGRNRGLWEKAKRFRELYEEFKRQML